MDDRVDALARMMEMHRQRNARMESLRAARKAWEKNDYGLYQPAEDVAMPVGKKLVAPKSYTQQLYDAMAQQAGTKATGLTWEALYQTAQQPQSVTSQWIGIVTGEAPPPEPTIVQSKKTGYATAWRCWRVQCIGEQYAFLRSATVDFFWVPGSPTRTQGGFVNTQVLYGRNRGLHAYQYYSHLIAEWKHLEYAYGRVALWGKVVKTERGYLAEYGYPLALWVGKHSQVVAGALRRIYGCEVSLGYPTDLEQRAV